MITIDSIQPDRIGDTHTVNIWTGCGQHVEEALAGVPQADRCPGHAEDGKPEGFFARILNR